MTQFTKGPWKPDWKKPGILRGIDGANGNSVIMTEEYAGTSWIDVGNWRDISLIAAAPDLYEALNELASILDGDIRTYVQEALERANAVLAKARGEA